MRLLILCLLFLNIYSVSGEEINVPSAVDTRFEINSQIEKCIKTMNKNALACLEKKQLKTFSHVARLSHGRLVFLGSERSIYYQKVSSGDDADFFINYFPEGRMYLVLHVFLEGYAFTLFSEKGEKYDLSNYPIFSPDKTRILDLNGDLAAQYTPNVIRIFRIENGKLCLEFKHSPKSWEPTNGKWINDGFVSFQEVHSETSGRKIGKLVFDSMERNWILEE